MRYFPVTLGGEVIGYLYASEGAEGAGFVRRKVDARDSLADRRWSDRLRAAAEAQLTPVQAVRRWVGAQEDGEAGGIAADVAERWAPDLRTLVELTKPTGARDLFPSSSDPGYGSSTGTPIRYLPITRGAEVLGYLWASESDDAAGYVKQAAAAADGLRAGALWRSRLAEAKGEGLTPAQALRRWIGAPAYLEFGGIAADAEELEAPSLQALQDLARRAAKARDPVRSGEQDRSPRRTRGTRSTPDEPVPDWMQRWDSELSPIPAAVPSYSFLTGAPVHYLPVTRGEQVLGYLWASATDDAADFVTRIDAGAGATNAKGWWIARLSEAHRDGLRPLEALRHWAGAPEDPVGGGVGTEEHMAPSLRALKEVAGRDDGE